MQETSELTPLARALGRIPTGLYIVTSKDGSEALGFVGSFVMQTGFDPPTVCVAIGKDRAHLAAIRSSGRFCISVLDGASSGVMGHFFKKYEGGESALDHVATAETPSGLPLMSEALAWMDCKVTGEHDSGDHIVVFGTVEHGDTARDGDPSVHLRKNGLGY